MKQTISIQKFILTVIILIICTSVVYAQPVKINNGDNEMSIGGIFSSYLNIRQRDPGHDNLDKNVFKLKDARLDIQGKVGDDYDYHLQVNLASISATTIDPESPALYDAYFTYKGWKAFDIRMGYSKVPYSYASLIESDQTPYWEHAEFAKGDLFSRRDIGIRLSRSFWNERIKAYAGMYTGVGEVILQNVDNDPSGAFEYIGRVEISYPEKCQYEDIDMNVSQTPNFSLGLNGRYSNRTLPAGKTFIPFEGGNYPDSIKVVNGEKYILGMDASVKYKGFMLQYEGHQMTGKPQSPNDPQLEGKGNLTNYFRVEGLKKLKRFLANSNPG